MTHDSFIAYYESLPIAEQVLPFDDNLMTWKSKINKKLPKKVQAELNQ